MTQYPKRLIEVDLPIKKISEHARREKAIRHGHISTLHIWRARRHLAACRAVICAALWPDPGDPNCPERFKTEAGRLMKAFRDKRSGKQRNWNDGIEIRQALLDFIADFANWDNSTVKDYLETSRALTQIAHESLGGEPGTRPLVVDPFAGGGSIPLEALRVGADAFASDLNPVAVLLNKVVLEYIPKYGQRLADEVRKWGEWIKKEAEKELSGFYPKDPDGATPIAYLWARTIKCEGPGCGAEVPLMRSLWLVKKVNRSVTLQLVPNPKAKRVDFQIIVKQHDGWLNQTDPKQIIENPEFDGTVKRGSATWPCCGYTTPVARIREQFRARRGGANDAKMTCVVSVRANEQGRFYRLPTERDLAAIAKSAIAFERKQKSHAGRLSMLPDEPLPPQGALGFRAQLYGMKTWGDMFTTRQALALISLAELIRKAGQKIRESDSTGLADSVTAVLALILDKLVDVGGTSLNYWKVDAECPVNVFVRQAIPMMWNFAEAVPISESSGSWSSQHDRQCYSLELSLFDYAQGHVARASATASQLPDDSAHCFFTDPPYYDAIPYADLSDFFYVWLKRTLDGLSILSQDDQLTSKSAECIVDPIRKKDSTFFEKTMAQALCEGRRVLEHQGIGIVVFAHKSTAGWESQLQAMVGAGWMITGSWPIDTEQDHRMRSRDSAALASSVHLVCRPRENPDGSLRTYEIGDWRDVLAELPKRIHEWMPRLAKEGVVGADAIFACLGPALEIFSRYSKGEKASGEVVTLKEYLEHVWAAVAKEALNMIFEGADTSGFEEDARLTAMWLWTLSAGVTNGNGNDKQVKLDINKNDAEEVDEDAEESKNTGKTKLGGYVLEYDAARKIAQGLGAHLEKLQTLVEVKGDKARLIPVDERTKALFGKAETDATIRKSKKKLPQKAFDFMKEFEEVEKSSTLGERHVTQLGNTTLDRLHQAMILFAAGRGEALKRFLVEEGVGRDERFWRLAQAFSAIYPKNSDEKRWVDGVLGRKKGLGF